MASYTVNEDAVRFVEGLIATHRYVLDSEWGEVQPDAAAENGYLDRHPWEEYGRWYLGLTDGASEETKSRYAFCVGDFARVHRAALIACVFRAAQWRHKRIELAAHDLLQQLDEAAGIG